MVKIRLNWQQTNRELRDISGMIKLVGEEKAGLLVEIQEKDWCEDCHIMPSIVGWFVKESIPNINVKPGDYLFRLECPSCLTQWVPESVESIGGFGVI